MLKGLLVAQALDATQASVSQGARLRLDRPIFDVRGCCRRRNRVFGVGVGASGSLDVSPPRIHRYAVREGISVPYEANGYLKE